jgi:hypothetical protein
LLGRTIEDADLSDYFKAHNPYAMESIRLRRNCLEITVSFFPMFYWVPVYFPHSFRDKLQEITREDILRQFGLQHNVPFDQELMANAIIYGEKGVNPTEQKYMYRIIEYGDIARRSSDDAGLDKTVRKLLTIAKALGNDDLWVYRQINQMEHVVDVRILRSINRVQERLSRTLSKMLQDASGGP